MLQVMTPAKPWSYAYSAWNQDAVQLIISPDENSMKKQK